MKFLVNRRMWIIGAGLLSLAGGALVRQSYQENVSDPGFVPVMPLQCELKSQDKQAVKHSASLQEHAITWTVTNHRHGTNAITAASGRLIVLHKPMKKTVREITDRLQAAGLPNLFILSSDSYIQVDSIPLPGTGKLDLRGIKVVAMERCKKLATLRSKSKCEV